MALILGKLAILNRRSVSGPKFANRNWYDLYLINYALPK